MISVRYLTSRLRVLGYGPGPWRFSQEDSTAHSVPYEDAAVEPSLPPILPAARQLAAGLERPDVLLTVAAGLGIQGPDNLCAVSAIAGPMRHPGFRAAETAWWTFRIVAFVPCVADQDQLAAECCRSETRRRRGTGRRELPGRAGKLAAKVGADGHGASPSRVISARQMGAPDALLFTHFIKLGFGTRYFTIVIVNCRQNRVACAAAW
jgi:hypothetical protein